MNDIEREKNRIKVAKYRARKKAREQGLDPDMLASSPTDHDPVDHSVYVSTAETEQLKEEWYGYGYEAGREDEHLDLEQAKDDAYEEGYDTGYDAGYDDGLDKAETPIYTQETLAWGTIALLLAGVLIVGLVAGTLYGGSRKSTPSLASSPAMQQTEASQ